MKSRWSVFVAVGSTVALGGCVHHSSANSVVGDSRARGCDSAAPTDAHDFSNDQIDLLVGQFLLVRVDTSQGKHHWNRDSDTITLSVPDSLEQVRMAADRLRQKRHLIPTLVGTSPWQSQWGRRLEPLEFDDSTLYKGCIECFDGSPDRLKITKVSPNGFWGAWHNDEAGVVKLSDQHGRRLPNPVGFFCAIRLPRSM